MRKKGGRDQSKNSGKKKRTRDGMVRCRKKGLNLVENWGGGGQGGGVEVKKSGGRVIPGTDEVPSPRGGGGTRSIKVPEGDWVKGKRHPEPKHPPKTGRLIRKERKDRFKRGEKKDKGLSGTKRGVFT